MSDSPHRDPGAAAAARVVQLQDELSQLRATLASGQPAGAKQRRRLWPWLALGLPVAAAVFVWWSGKPASQTVMRTNGGTSLTVLFRTSVEHVEFQTDDGKTVIPALWPATTMVDSDDTASQAPTRAASVLLKDSLVAPDGPTKVRVRYRAWGLPRSATVELDAKRDGNRFMKSVLEGLPQWVAFRSYDGKLLLYFTTLLAYKPALREIRWGLGDAALERTVHFTPSTEAGIDEGDEVYTAIPHGTHHVRVQLRWADGTSSEVRTILRSDAEIR